MSRTDSTTTVWGWVQDTYPAFSDELACCESEHQIRRTLIHNARLSGAIDSTDMVLADWHWIASTLLWMRLNGVKFGANIK